MNSTSGPPDPTPPTGLTVMAVEGRGLIDPAEPVLRADDPGVTRGDGCFEGVRVFQGRTQLLDGHLDRMIASAQSLGIVLDLSSMRDLVAEALAAWPADREAAMKLVLTRGPANAGPVQFVTITELGESAVRTRRDGSRVTTLSRGFTSDAFAARPWLLGGVKTLSYAVNMAADRTAAERGCDDVVFVSTDGAVLEAPTAAVVTIDDAGVLRTVAPGENGILASITTAELFAAAERAGIATDFGTLSIADLHASEACWLVSAVRGPIEIVELDGQARDRHPDLHARVRALAGF